MNRVGRTGLTLAAVLGFGAAMAAVRLLATRTRKPG